MFDLIRKDVKETIGNYISGLLDLELKDHLKRDRYERSAEDDPDYRNGSYNRRFCMKSVGDTTITVPRDRKGTYKPKALPRFQRYENSIKEDLTLMYLTGISTRSLSLLFNKLIGRKLSSQEVSNANKELVPAIEKWRTRDLSAENIKYIYLDGVNFSMRIKKIQTVPVLVAIGVDINGCRQVLGFQSGDKESASSWRQFFKDLKSRGLNGSSVKLGIMDGLAGLEKVFKEEFYNSEVQRCQVHVANTKADVYKANGFMSAGVVLSKVQVKHKKEVADDLRSIFYASSKDKAVGFFKEFKNKYDKDFPSAVKSLTNSIDSSLTFFKFPQEDWISLRTTNIIERLNKEFKRRTKSMEILAGENSSYNLLAFISIKMEAAWAHNIVGKVKPNLPFFNKIKENI